MSLPKLVLPRAIIFTFVYGVKDFQNCKGSFKAVALQLLQTKVPKIKP